MVTCSMFHISIRKFCMYRYVMYCIFDDFYTAEVSLSQILRKINIKEIFHCVNNVNEAPCINVYKYRNYALACTFYIFLSLPYVYIEFAYNILI